MKLRFRKEVLRFWAGIFGLVLLFFFLVKYPRLVGCFFVLSFPGYILSFLIVRDEINFLERFLISVPLGSLFLILIRFLSYAGIPITKSLVFFIMILLPLLLAVIRINWLKKHYSGILFEKGRLCRRKAHALISSNGWLILAAALVVIISASIWGPLAQGERLPLSDQVVNQHTIIWYLDSISQHHRIPQWNSEVAGGLPYVLFDSYFFYERIATMHLILPLKTVTFSQNMYVFFSAMMIALGILCLGRRLGLDYHYCVLAAIFFVTNPFLASKFGYSGDMKELSTFAIIPALIIVFLLAQDQPVHYVLLALLGVALYHFHLISFIVIMIFLAACFVIYRLVHRKAVTAREVKSLLLAALIFLVMVSFHALPFILNQGYANAGRWSITHNFETWCGSFIRFLFQNSTPGMFTSGLNAYYVVLGLLGVVALISCHVLACRRDKGRLCGSRDADLLVVFFGFLALYLSFLVPFLNSKVLSKVGLDRVVLLYFLVFGRMIPQILRFSSRKIFKAAVIVLFVIVLAGPAALTMKDFSGWVNERAQNGMFKEYYQMLDGIGPGRLITYGVYAYAVEPMIPVHSKSLGMITHTNPVAARTYPEYEFKDGSESFPNLELGIPYIVNRFRTTFTRYLLIFRCGGRGGDAAEQLFLYYASQNEGRLRNLHRDDCVTLIEVPDSNYIESVEISLFDIPKEELYTMNNSWRVFGFLDKADYDEFGHDHSISSAGDILEIPEPAVYEYRFQNYDHLVITGDFKDGRWLIVKDHYFPRWHAYQNGHEIEIRESNLGTMLIRTEAGTQIDLISKPFEYERIAAVLAVIMLFFAFFSRVLFESDGPAKSRGQAKGAA